MSEEEEWRPVVGFEGLYEVSDHGRVRSLARNIVRSTGSVHPQNGRIRRLVTDRVGRMSITLWKGNQQKMMRVHRLVLEAFVGPCPAGMEACHGDGNASNNHLSNLRWDTRVENMADMERHGTRSRGERSASARLTESDVTEIIRQRAEGIERAVLSARFGVDYETIGDIDRGMTWKHLDHIRDQYGPPVYAAPKLTEERVRELRRRVRRKDYRSLEKLAAEFGISRAAIRDIMQGRLWAHVTDNEEEAA